MNERRAPRGILHVYAHPDDESFGNPGTIALYAGRGVAMSLLTATRGEAGETGGLCPPEELGDLREKELRCACAALGIGRLELWDYPDGGLAGVDRGEAVARLAAFLRRTRPEVIVTYGGDGVTRHPDHIAVSRWTGEAFRRLREEDASAAPARLYHRVVPEGRRAAYARADLVYRDDFTTVVDARAVPWARRRAEACHRSQRPHTDHGDPRLFEMGLVDYYVRAHPPWEGGPLEADLFGGAFHPEEAALP